MVLKFGGTSVADIPQIKNIALKIKLEVEKGNKVIVVVSAMSGVTNNLINLYYKYLMLVICQIADLVWMRTFLDCKFQQVTDGFQE